MNYNCDEMWDWQGDDCGLEDNTSIELPECLLNGSNQYENHLPSFDDENTPVKACGDLAYHVTNNEVMGKELEENREHSSQVKRRRMLHFESEILDSTHPRDEIFLRSKESQNSFEDAIADMSEWVAGFAEGPAESSSEYLDPSSEGWIADCFNDTEMHFSAEDSSSGAPSASDIQVDNRELYATTPEYDVNTVEKHPVHSPGNVVFKGRKSYMRTTPKLASSVVYPFTFIKPCGVHGDVTLKDINKRIHTPPRPKQTEQDPSVSYPTSAFSGKPVVGKTKIRTEGGEGSITILRTKG